MNRLGKPYPKRSLAFLLLALLGGCITLQQEPGGYQPFFFIQMTDPQFGMFANNSSFQEETRLFQEAIAHANRLGPAFVVITGDLVNKPGDPAQIAELQRIASQLHEHIPIYWVAGNHDLGNVPSQATLAAYRVSFGSDWYSFTCGNWRFIVLNSTIILRPDSVEAERARQWAWLENILTVDARSRNGTIVFQHHPFFLPIPARRTVAIIFPKAQRTRYLELFRSNGVSAVFAGHYHGNGYSRYGDLEIVITGPVGMPLWQDPSGFRVVEVFPDHIEHTYYGFANMPETITLEKQPAVRARP